MKNGNGSTQEGLPHPKDGQKLIATRLFFEALFAFMGKDRAREFYRKVQEASEEKNIQNTPSPPTNPDEKK